MLRAVLRFRLLAMLAVLGSQIVSGITSARAEPHDCFVISVVDEATGRGVPLVQLETTSNVSYFTDSNGLIAYSDPALMGQTVYFRIHSDGYEYPRDGFGNRGRAFAIVPGGSATVKLKRINLAERLYRVTGEGIYRDTLLAGRKAPLEQPLLNSQVTGQDTVMMCPYRGKLYWFWGDTNRLGYPLGNFAASGAVSDFPGHGGLDPAVGVDLHYFAKQDGFVKPMLDIPGDGPKWLFGLMTLDDPAGRQRLLARYYRMKSLTEVLETGLVLFDDDAKAFRKLVEFPRITSLGPDARPIRVRSGAVDYFYFFNLRSLPAIRVPADWKQVQQLESYETFTPLKPGGGTELERDTAGRLVYGWKHNAPPLSQDQQRTLVAAGRMKRDEGPWQLRDVETDRPIDVKFGSVCWNAYRRCWIALMQRLPGAIYYAEADTPVGPWVYAKRVVDHEHYTFYWPAQHPEFDAEGGKVIYFEGTYTAEFSDARAKTPRYDYNQLMYRLRLDDPRLALPAPVYRLAGGRLCQRSGVSDWSAVVGIEGFAVPPRDPTASLSEEQLRTTIRPSPVSALILERDAQPR